jgi:hypothetical protein
VEVSHPFLVFWREDSERFAFQVRSGALKGPEGVGAVLLLKEWALPVYR